MREVDRTKKDALRPAALLLAVTVLAVACGTMQPAGTHRSPAPLVKFRAYTVPRSEPDSDSYTTTAHPPVETTPGRRGEASLGLP